MQTAQINISVNAQGAEKSVQNLSNSINQAGGSAQSLKAELRQITQELQSLEPGSARFTELSQRAGQLRDQIADTSAVISATAGNVTENFGRALGNSIQLGVAGFQALSSAQVLFGVENKDLQKTLAQMGALLNLSQAIETFGGLGDKLTEIKAGFTPLLQSLGLLKTTQVQVAASTGAAVVATEAEAVALTTEAAAAGGAAVATGAFATALNALPLVAIVTALGLLVAGLINYASGQDQASKAEEERRKQLEALRVEEEKQKQTIAAESGEFVLLVERLKQTNAGSKERKFLIDQINSTYGTTFKNLGDEIAFQASLNLAVQDYINFQTNKYNLQKNQEAFNKVLEKEGTAQEDLKRKTEAYFKLKKEVEARTQPANYATYDYLAKLKLEYDNATAAVEKLKQRKEQLAKSSTTLLSAQNDLTQGGKRYEVQTNHNTVATRNQGTETNNLVEELKDYESILRQIQTTAENLNKSEDEVYKKRAEVFDKSINLVEIEQKTREEAIINEYKAVETAITKELTQRKIKTEEKKRLLELEKLNEANLTRALSIENEKRKLDIEIQTFNILKEYEKRSELIKAENDALQREIRFGDGNTSDTLAQLYIKDRNNFIREIDTKLLRSKYSNRIELEEYEKLLKEKLELQKTNLNQQFLDAQYVAQADFDRQKQLEKDRVEASKDYQVKITQVQIAENQYRYDAEVSIANKAVLEIQKLSEQEREDKRKKLENELKDTEQAIKDQEAVIAKTKQGTEQRRVEIAKLADLQIVRNSQDAALQQYKTDLVLTQKLSDEQIAVQNNLIQTLVNLNYEKNAKIEEAQSELNANLNAETIKTEDEIRDERIKRLDEYLAYVQQAFQQASSVISQFAKQQQEIRTTQLEDAIALDKERIESQFAANLISREQYDNAIEQLNQRQQQDQLQIDRKNFRTEKALNIVGATIDGARAVLGAFAGTPGGIVVRTIAATLAGIFAATQVALIARQEFKAADGGIVPGDGSGEIDSVPSRLAPGESVINSRSTQAFLPLLSAINEIGGGQSFVPDLPPTSAPQRFAPIFVDNQNKEPIRAYVVESDITNSQKRIARIERSTRF